MLKTHYAPPILLQSGNRNLAEPDNAGRLVSQSTNCPTRILSGSHMNVKERTDHYVSKKLSFTIAVLSFNLSVKRSKTLN